MSGIQAKLLATALLTVMGLMMIGAARQDSATVDEASQIATGYLYWKGIPTRMGSAEHPPLGYMLDGLPLSFMDVKLSETAQAMAQGELSLPWTLSWSGRVVPVQALLTPGSQGTYVRIPPLGDTLVHWQFPPPYPMQNWYYIPGGEAQLFGKVLLYGGDNDGDKLLFATRLVQIIVTLLIGLLIFLWVRCVSGQYVWALVALALWVFQPVALAFGHIANADIGATFGFVASVYLFGRLIENPTFKNAALCGVAVGFTLLVKLTGLLLAPVFLAATAVAWKRLQLPISRVCQLAGVVALTSWLVIVVVLWPFSASPPPLSSAEAAVFDVPAWFRTFGSVLIPADFFKNIALAFGHAKGGHDAYFLGEWSHTGWWYFFPVVFLLKTPVAFVLLLAGGLVVFFRNIKSARPLESLAWLAAGVYLLGVMRSNASTGIRHLLPMFPLLAVAIGCALARVRNRNARFAIGALVGWQAVTTILAYPLYIQFFTEAVGGARNGYKYLYDSNLDWGQDARRLQQFLQEHQIGHIYLDYFGNQFSIEYLKIPNTRVSAETARQIQQGTLVVSVSQLLRPEWSWLRESRSPFARVADTLFVYEIH